MRWPERKHIALWVRCTQIYERRQNMGTGIDNPAMVMVKQTASFRPGNSVRDAGAGGSNPLTPTRISAKFPARSTVSLWYKRTGAALALTLTLLLAAPAHAEPPDIADLVGVHQEMRRAATIPEPTWPLLDGKFDCEDWARWAAAALEARGWPQEALGYYLGYGLDGAPHMALCAVLDGYESPICLDRQMNMITPLSAYGSEWKRVDFR